MALPEEILTLLAIVFFSVVQNLFNFQFLLLRAGLEFQEYLQIVPFWLLFEEDILHTQHNPERRIHTCSRI